MQQALELDYTLDEAQFAEDWSGLLTLASQPGITTKSLFTFLFLFTSFVYIFFVVMKDKQ